MIKPFHIAGIKGPYGSGAASQSAAPAERIFETDPILHTEGAGSFILQKGRLAFVNEKFPACWAMRPMH
jgi:hypothetical protein